MDGKSARRFGCLILCLAAAGAALAEQPTGGQIWPRYFFCGFNQQVEGLVTRPAGAWTLGNQGSALEIQDLGAGTWAAAWVENGFGWTDHILQVCAQYKGGSANQLGLIYRLQDPDNYYMFTLNEGSTAALSLCVNGTIVRSEAAAFAYSADDWYVLRVEVYGTEHTAKIDGVPVLTWSDATFAMGSGGLVARGSHAWFDNLISLHRPGFLPPPTPGPGPVQPATLALAGANPFSSRATLALTLSNEGSATVRIHDAMGRLVATLLQGVLPAGEHRLSWSGLSQTGLPAPNGIYFCTLQTGDQHAVRRILLQR